jgi:hypothetical protein
MVPRENQNDVLFVLLECVDILEDSIGRPLVPALIQSLLGRDQADKLPQWAAEDIPSLPNMTTERNRLVLGENVDFANIRVHAIAQSEIDDSVNGTKWDCRLCPVSGEGIEPFPLSSCQNHGEYIVHDLLRESIKERLDALRSSISNLNSPAETTTQRKIQTR